MMLPNHIDKSVVEIESRIIILKYLLMFKHEVLYLRIKYHNDSLTKGLSQNLNIDMRLREPIVLG